MATRVPSLMRWPHIRRRDSWGVIPNGSGALSRKLLLVSATLTLAMAAAAPLDARPYDGTAFKGRIAWSADGNHNDPDDWIASPLALAIFASAGLKDRLVHFDYNCILPQ